MQDFNVNILKDNNQAKNKQELLDFMDKFQLKSQFSESIIKARFQLAHIWANIPRNKCKSSVAKAYWLDFHKLVYIAFKLPNTLPVYNKKTINISIHLNYNVCDYLHVNVAFST